MATHKKDARPSTKEDHEQGQTRKKKDSRGGEKGDRRFQYKGAVLQLRSAFPAHARFRRVITLTAVEWEPVRNGLISVYSRDLDSQFGLDDAQRLRDRLVTFLPPGSIIAGEVGLCGCPSDSGQANGKYNFLSISFHSNQNDGNTPVASTLR
jgi:hypothetical protein